MTQFRVHNKCFLCEEQSGDVHGFVSHHFHVSPPQRYCFVALDVSVCCLMTYSVDILYDMIHLYG